ncbi:MAG: hypothetical protein A3K10_03920 [Bacteroidetes bacterium RIFCSPLOWO2_12_FULL_31_6]|nr:MAG: hypothetical protein A3K10_03920 [Bacteroidetes bacterium RIFCSPLOWO2_12_FULL_31_6]
MNQNKDRNKLIKVIKFTIVIFCFLLYGNSIKNNYAIDDDFVTTTNPQNPNSKIEKGIRGIPKIFATHYFESDQQSFEYRPMVLVTYAIEYQFFKSNPHISHFINVALYALTCVLLFVILSTLLSSYPIIFPLLITFLFIAHPIHSEVVNNLKSRDELLAFLFGLCSLYFFLKKVKLSSWKYLFWAVLFFLLALFSKKSAILFIAIIPISIYFFTEIKLKKAIFYFVIPLAIFIGYKIFMRIMFYHTVVVREFAFFENPLFYEPDFLNRIPMAFYTIGYYFKLLVFPHPLSCYYGFKTIPLANWSFISVWISMLFHVFIGIYAVLKFSKKSIFSYTIIIYLIGIFPFSNLYTPVVGIIGERFIYLASLGFCIGIAYLLFLVFKIEHWNKTKSWSNYKTLFKTIVGCILLMYAVKVITRNADWKDELTLFRKDVSNYENSCNLNYITANKLSRQLAQTPVGAERNTLISEATFHFKKTAELMKEGTDIYSQDDITLNNLGRIYVDVFNDANLAQPIFKKVITVNPNNEVAQYNYAYCFEKRNLQDSAIFWYEKMLFNNTNYSLIYSRLHELYYQRKKFDKAVVSDKKALKTNPEKIELYINLGNSYMLNGDTLDGLKYFEAAATKPPLDYVLLQNVANVFKTIGDTNKAIYYEEKSRIVRGEMK